MREIWGIDVVPHSVPEIEDADSSYCMTEDISHGSDLVN